MKIENLRRIKKKPFVISILFIFFLLFTFNSALTVNSSPSDEKQDITMQWSEKTPRGHIVIDIDTDPGFPGIVALTKSGPYHYLLRFTGFEWEIVHKFSAEDYISYFGDPIRIAAKRTSRPGIPNFLGRVHVKTDIYSIVTYQTDPVSITWIFEMVQKTYYIKTPGHWPYIHQYKRNYWKGICGDVSDVSVAADRHYIWYTSGDLLTRYDSDLNQKIVWRLDQLSGDMINLDVCYSSSKKEFYITIVTIDGSLSVSINKYGDTSLYTIVYQEMGTGTAGDVTIESSVNDNNYFIWFTGFEERGPNIYRWKWDPLGMNEKEWAKPGLGTRITVDIAGNPWVMNGEGKVFKGRVIGSSSGISEWEVGKTYSIGDVVSYDGYSYECIQAHTAYASNWTPPNTPALWKRI